MTDEIARLAVELVAARLEAVFRGARGEPAQELLQGSYLAGVALSNARLGLVHGLAHPLGTRYHAGHGLVCGVCLPPVLEFNREVIGGKYDALSRTVGSDFLGFVTALLDRLGIQSPFRGNPLRDRDGIVRETLASGSTTANPRPVNEKDVTELLDRIFTGDSHEPETQSDLCAPQCSPVPGQAGGRQPDP
jgi:alcohol dehydrogenase class IV